MSFTLLNPMDATKPDTERSSFDDVPVETIADIFCYIYQSLDVAAHTKRNHALTPIKQVCRQWNDIVSRTPILWSVIRVTGPNSDPDWKRRIQVHLERSGTVPLHLVVEAGYLEDEVTELLECHRSRWQRLSFTTCAVGPADGAREVALADPHPFLGSTVPELKTLEILGRRDVGGGFSVATTVDAPKLDKITCIYHPITFKEGQYPPIISLKTEWRDNSFSSEMPLSSILIFVETLLDLDVSGNAGWDASAYPETPIQFPRLQRLRFQNWNSSSVRFLERTNLPNLQRLHIQTGGGTIPAEDFPTFEKLHTLVWEESAEPLHNTTALKFLLDASPNLVVLSTHNNIDPKTMLLHRPASSNIVAVLVAQSFSGKLRYCRQLREVRMNRAMIDQLDWLTDQRPLLETITLAAPYYGDYAEESGKRHLLKAKATRLEQVKKRVKLVMLSRL